MTDHRVLVEVCVDSVASAIAAQRGGASRIELCSSLNDGGVTPSTGLIETTRASVSIPIHVMIRPRAADFCYDEHEFAGMQRDIVKAKKLGADGIVFGILSAEGNVDAERTKQLTDLARPLPVTFHRAFDMTSDLFHALEDLCSIGMDRVLTSGGEKTSLLGRERIAQLVQKAQGRIGIMPGSGIKPENARQLVADTGVGEIHVGLRTPRPSPMQYQNSRVSIGVAEGREYQRFGVLEEDVRRLCAALADSEP